MYNLALGTVASNTETRITAYSAQPAGVAVSILVRSG